MVVYVCVCVCMYVCVYMCVCVCVSTSSIEIDQYIKVDSTIALFAPSDLCDVGNTI